MSYTITFLDPTTRRPIPIEAPGGMPVSGPPDAIRITENYRHFYANVFGGEGIRTLYGRTGAECIPLLESVIAVLGTDAIADYWADTEGNAGAALVPLLAWAKANPTGIFQGN